MTNETDPDPVPDQNPTDEEEISAETKAPSIFQVYDDFDTPGYSLTDYAEKWITPNGLGEMTVSDTRDFSGGYLSLGAVPFQTASDVDVDDHRKYLAVSSHTFPVPKNGTLVLSSDIKASTQGTVPDLLQQGVYGPPGTWLDPANPPTPPGYSARLLQGQQAALLMNVLDFCTGQLFDWFIASDTAFALIERLPTTVTGNVSNPDCREATEVGIDKMYTQIIREVPVTPDAWHHVDIALTRHDGEAWVDYFLDDQPIAHVANIGIPLDRQAVAFTGTYPSLGSGERLADQLDGPYWSRPVLAVGRVPIPAPGSSGAERLDPGADPSSPRCCRPSAPVRPGGQRVVRQLHNAGDLGERQGRKSVRNLERARRGAGLTPIPVRTKEPDTMRIDVHAHYWTDEYLDLMVDLGKTGTGAQRGLGAGDGEELVARLALMERAGVDIQVLSAAPQMPYAADKDKARRRKVGWRNVGGTFVSTRERHRARRCRRNHPTVCFRPAAGIGEVKALRDEGPQPSLIRTITEPWCVRVP